MKDYERTFVSQMEAASRDGTSFQTVSDAAIKHKLGDGPGEILLRSLSKAARVDPGYFVREVSKVFGRGAIGIYDAIVDEARERRHASAPEETAYQSTVEELLEGIRAESEERIQIVSFAN